VTWFWWLLGVIVVVVWIATIVNIIQRRHSFSKAALFAWLIIVIVFPLVGTLAYLIVNGTASATTGDSARGGRIA
jgi:uncharacterized protein YhhL (DUF1145 family)